MMYSDKIVTAIKVNGRILRESGDVVSLPFGCEYSVLVKNLNSVRAQFKLSVDGSDATDGTSLIIAPNSSIELERFIRNGNLQAGNRFKFIERTAEVEAHRGIGSDDGLIRVEAWKERVQQFMDIPVQRCPLPPAKPWRPPSVRPGQPMMRGPRDRSPISARSASLGGMRSTSRMDSARVEVERGSSDVGITVPGGESRQRFFATSGFPLEPQSVVIVMRLRGEVAGVLVEAPLTVDAKPTCSACGLKGKAESKFCGRCGTALQLI